MALQTSNRWSRKLLALLALLTIILLGGTPASAAANAFTVTTKFPIELFVYVPCANGGMGEDIHVSGELNDVFHITSDGAGGLHVKLHDNPQGVSGTGFSTGAKYQATGVTQSQFTAKVGYEETYVNNFRMIGQGPGNNFLVHETYHVTINANGTLTAFVDNFRVECR